MKKIYRLEFEIEANVCIKNAPPNTATKYKQNMPQTENKTTNPKPDALTQVSDIIPYHTKKK